MGRDVLYMRTYRSSSCRVYGRSVYSYLLRDLVYARRTAVLCTSCKIRGTGPVPAPVRVLCIPVQGEAAGIGKACAG